METLLTLAAGVFLVSICFLSCKKRSEITHRCPKCGHTCNASPWSSGLRHAGGEPVHNFTCNNCGHKFTD